MKILLNLLILLNLINKVKLTTSIKTYPTVELKENCRIGSEVVRLFATSNDENIKLVLLNLGGFERNLFEIKKEKIITINEIDREELIISKRCFNRLKCLIEVHILVNDGEQYWVIPIHILE